MYTCSLWFVAAWKSCSVCVTPATSSMCRLPLLLRAITLLCVYVHNIICVPPTPVALLPRISWVSRSLWTWKFLSPCLWYMKIRFVLCGSYLVLTPYHSCLVCSISVLQVAMGVLRHVFGVFNQCASSGHGCAKTRAVCVVMVHFRASLIYHTAFCCHANAVRSFVSHKCTCVMLQRMMGKEYIADSPDKTGKLNRSARTNW